MADTTIGAANLGVGPISTVEDEFLRTSDGEIIGGFRKISISGSIVGNTGEEIMGKLKAIRELGARAECINIATTAYTGRARIDNVTIPQGPDPSWINQGEFSIELTAPMTEIPPNRFNFVASDNVREFSQSESLSLGDESHGYAFTLKNNDGGDDLELSKTFVKWSTKMSIKCEPFCSSSNSGERSAMEILESLVYGGPTSEFKDIEGKFVGCFRHDDPLKNYKGWTRYLGSRSLDISSDGVVSFSSSVMLVEPTCAPLLAFVDINFTTSDTYAEPKSETHTISGNIQGLSKISWSDNLVQLSSVCPDNKVNNAIAVFNQMSGIIKLHDKTFKPNYLPLELEKKENCPKPSPLTAACNTNTNPNKIPGLLKPTTSSVSVNRITGDLNFSISWATSDGADKCVGGDGATDNLSIIITPATEHFASHSIPRYGTMMQRMGSFKNEKVSLTYSKAGAAALGFCDPAPLPAKCTGAGTSFNTGILEWLEENWKNKTYLLITWTKTLTNTSYTENQEYIQTCP